MCCWGSDPDCKYAIVRKCRPSRCRCRGCRGCRCGSYLCRRSSSCSSSSRSPSPAPKCKKGKEKEKEKDKEKEAPPAPPAPIVYIQSPPPPPAPPSGWSYVRPFDVCATRDRHVITLTHYDQPGPRGGPTLKMRGQHFTDGKEDWTDEQSVRTLPQPDGTLAHSCSALQWHGTRAEGGWQAAAQVLGIPGSYAPQVCDIPS